MDTLHKNTKLYEYAHVYMDDEWVNKWIKRWADGQMKDKRIYNKESAHIVTETYQS